MLIQPEAGGEFAPCFTLGDIGLSYKGYLAITSDNFSEEFISDIDIYSIKIVNKDPKAYQDMKQSKLEYGDDTG